MSMCSPDQFPYHTSEALIAYDCLPESVGPSIPTLSFTKLRKHIATLLKVLNLNDTELDQLADFLEHDIRVQQQYYRLPESTLQLAKISKQLMALESGRLAEFKAKNLNERHIDPDSKWKIWCLMYAFDFYLGHLHICFSSEPVQLQNNRSDDEQSPVTEVQVAKHLVDTSTSEERRCMDLATRDQCPAKTSTGCREVQRKSWDREEVQAVQKHLVRFIQTCWVPGNRDYVAFLMAEPSILKDRNWLGVKFYIKNYITAIKRDQTC
ncbi:uncharacterized protein LOC142097053 [Mixophyes fleayi]|uniref:uncharacterized protein LOC142097053 n=1 Tax=Mixophyes fleayi TaxID=3061075 RepID=UPI003F4E0672